MKLLVPIDLSAATAGVLDTARRVASATRGAVWLLNVAPPDPAFIGYEVGPEVVRGQVARELREDHRALQAHAQSLRDSGIEVTALHIQGSTAETILREAARLPADLIIMATHGHGAVFDLLVGSISQAVLRASPVPVLMVQARNAPAA
ncbi:MAG: universal stress protein [Xanthomonadales bacterium]|nr:universal stress protein [Xanthomonadales bacterium]